MQTGNVLVDLLQTKVAKTLCILSPLNNQWETMNNVSLSSVLCYVQSWVEHGRQASPWFPANQWFARNLLPFCMASPRAKATTMETLSCTHACRASAWRYNSLHCVRRITYHTDWTESSQITRSHMTSPQESLAAYLRSKQEELSHYSWNTDTHWHSSLYSLSACCSTMSTFHYTNRGTSCVL